MRTVIRPPQRRELDGILDEVPEDLLEPGRVGVDVVLGGRQLQLAARAGIPASSARQTSAACWMMRWASTEEMSRVNRPVLARVRSRRSSINRDSTSMLRWIIAIVDRISGSRLESSQQVGDGQQDRGQRGAQLVAEDRQELIFRSARRLGGLLGFLQLLGIASALRDVPEDDDGPACDPARSRSGRPLARTHRSWSDPGGLTISSMSSTSSPSKGALQRPPGRRVGESDGLTIRIVDAANQCIDRDRFDPDAEETPGGGIEDQGPARPFGDDDGIADAVEDRPQDGGLLAEHLLRPDALEHLRLEGRVGLGELGRALPDPDLQLVMSPAERNLRPFFAR